MATSERDQRILQDLENDLLAEDRRSGSSAVRRRPGTLAGALAGLVVGLLVLVVGLSLASPLGTIVGVAGSLAFVGGTSLGVHTIIRRLTTRRRPGRTAAKR